LRTTYNDGVEGSFTSLPFGDGLATVSGSDTDANHYATLDHDNESDTEHAEFRQSSSAQGHWLAPDPYIGSYDPSNPQSMNRYVYALNNPLSYYDPLGLDYGFDCGDNCVGVVGTDDGGDVCDADPFGCSTTPGGIPIPSIPLIPPVDPANPSGVPTKKNVFACASAAANKVSIAGGLHTLGVPTTGAGGFITDALGGNAFSGATDLVQSLATGQSGSGEDTHSVFYNMAQGVAAGPTQGFGGAVTLAGISIEDTPWTSGPTDVATGAILTGVNSGLNAGGSIVTLAGEASTAGLTATEFVSGVGEIKLGYDAVTYFGSLIGCGLGVIQ
jgi:RHS repeat-associated protein